MNKEFHVSLQGNDLADGSKSSPFRTISKAAECAEAGDKVIVHAGEYREWVKPQHGGTSNINRIVFEAAEGEKVVIKGSERIVNWEPYKGDAWKTVLPNSFFGDYNPYNEPLRGDWFLYPEDDSVHAGDVYLNGKSFYEAKSVDEVVNPVMRKEGVRPDWSPYPEYIPHPEDTLYQWYAEVDEENTTIYANFQGADPNSELVEINVRQSCFYPERTGLDYITVRGFEMTQAACQWAPPTADQPGLIGPHWSKGWIIENNIIHDAKCSAISIGKEISTGHNMFTRHFRKPGYQYQMEAVFRALQIGWSKETIGSHIIRNNTIYDCGQNGIVGHMGCIFSEIYNNHIYNIALKHEFFGHEIAGIKLHAAIDVQIYNNNIHDCTLGTWLDWQVQGTRVSKNLFYNNNRDLMVEVTHGPHLVDNNIFASAYNFDNVAQGGAFVNNLCCGVMRRIDVLDRSTPYHFPHTTQVAGTAVVYGGDDRLYNNIFVGGMENDEVFISGTAGYAGCTTSLEEYVDLVKNGVNEDLGSFMKYKEAAYIASNAYLNGANPFDREEELFVSASNPEVRITEQDGKTYLEFTAEKGLFELSASVIDTEKLGMVRIVEAAFEDPNGNPIVLDTDYFGEVRDEQLLGPIAGLKEGFNRIVVWEE